MRKIRRPVFREENQNLLSEWLVRAADKKAVAKSLGTTYITLLRRVKSITDDGEKITDIFSFNDILHLIDLQNVDASTPDVSERMTTKEQKLNEQVMQVAKALKATGREVDIEELKKSILGDQKNGADKGKTDDKK
ncbi:hypothetical protein ABC418_00805 [Lactiplantibacillus plantarum]|uniref:hypothetical protein n=1 Tax=Lactiplantibacillus plantarum TaxID=1590 RepID=UPI003965B0F6